MIEVRSLRKSYGRGESLQRVLKDVSCTIPAGSFTAVVGRSGSGKTTLLNLLAGLDTPDSGEIIAAGVPLHGKSQEFLAAFRLRRIGLVFQFFNLLPTLTLRENVALAAYLAGKSRGDADKSADELLTLVGLASYARRLPHEVSGGEIQRAALARALINEPEFLFADEPTGNLDRVNSEKVLGLLVELARAKGTSLVIVSHDPLIEEKADAVLRLVDGEIVS